MDGLVVVMVKGELVHVKPRAQVLGRGEGNKRDTRLVHVLSG